MKILEINVFPLSVIAMAASLSSSAFAAPLVGVEMPAPDFSWARRTRVASSGCVFDEKFSYPRKVEGEYVCETTALVTARCSKAGTADERESSSTCSYFAILHAGKKNCTSLSYERDLFSSDVFGRDRTFLRTMREAAVILNNELRYPSRSFRRLGHSIRQELKGRGMSSATHLNTALSEDGNKEVERFALSFHLPEMKAVVVLNFNSDGSNPEWSLMLESHSGYGSEK